MINPLRRLLRFLSRRRRGRRRMMIIGFYPTRRQS